jgi:hypothetical protein
MSEFRTDPLVWVKDDMGDRFLCYMDALTNPNTVSDREKIQCVDDASGLPNPMSVPGEGRLKFSESRSPN